MSSLSVDDFSSSLNSMPAAARRSRAVRLRAARCRGLQLVLDLPPHGLQVIDHVRRLVEILDDALLHLGRGDEVGVRRRRSADPSGPRTAASASGRRPSPCSVYLPGAASGPTCACASPQCVTGRVSWPRNRGSFQMFGFSGGVVRRRDDARRVVPQIPRQTIQALHAPPRPSSARPRPGVQQSRPSSARPTATSR